MLPSIAISAAVAVSAVLSLGHDKSAEIVFVGDAMQHESQLKAAKCPDGSYDFSHYYTALKPYIASADYAVVNLETPLGGSPYSGYPMFCAPDSYLDALKEAGFDLILTANNHCLDRRDKGLRRTIATIENAGLPWVGTYTDSAQRNEVLPRIIDIKGFKVAFLNYTYGTNGIEIQGNVVVDFISRPKIAADVKNARAAGAEFIVAAMHWGEEYHLLPNASQTSLANYLTDLGVDMIIGGHPHVIQPMEMRYSTRNDKNVFLCYSLGNFISGMKKIDTRGGATARIRLTRDAQGNARVSDASYRLVYVLPPDGEAKTHRLIPAEEDVPQELRSAKEQFIKNATTIFNQHNINVPADTTSMLEYQLDMLLKNFEQTPSTID